MKNDQPRIINYWKLFLLRYLLLGKGVVDLELCQKEAIELLKYFLDFTQELNLKRISAGVTEQTATCLLDKHKNDERGFIKKAIDRKLTLKDLHLLLKNNSSASNNNIRINSASDILCNLIIVFDFKQSEAKIKNLLDVYIKLILQNRLKTHIRISLTTNFYSYYYQKNHFIKSIPRYLEECVSDEINLLEGRNGKLFGEEDHRTTFLETILLLEQEGLVTITKMGIAESESYLLTMFTVKVSDFIKRSTISPKITPTLSSPPPNGWGVATVETKAHITKGGQKVFTFPNNWSAKYRYFVCLWKNYGQKVDYKTLYEFESGLTYPGREKVWVVNRRVRDTITKLKGELKNLPIRIQISKGFILTID